MSTLNMKKVSLKAKRSQAWYCVPLILPLRWENEAGFQI